MGEPDYESAYRNLQARLFEVLFFLAGCEENGTDSVPVEQMARLINRAIDRSRPAHV